MAWVTAMALDERLSQNLELPSQTEFFCLFWCSDADHQKHVPVMLLYGLWLCPMVMLLPLRPSGLSFNPAGDIPDELLHPMRCKGWSFTGRVNPRLGQFLAGY